MSVHLVDKGNFRPIDDTFLMKSLDVFQDLSAIQDEYGKNDTDTFMNEVHDAIAAKYLCFTHINTEKHGFDARRPSLIDDFQYEYLEVKTASFDAKSWQATFNDTNLEKANLFKQPNVHLALSVWKGAANLLFIVYGSNPLLGEFLERKVKDFVFRHTTVRSTQSISLSKLVNEFGFRIYAVHKTKEQIYELIRLRCGKNIPRHYIHDIEEFGLPKTSEQTQYFNHSQVRPSFYH